MKVHTFNTIIISCLPSLIAAAGLRNGRELGSDCTNSFICPAHSYRKPHRACYNNFDDCECEAGYTKNGHHCVPVCKNDFQCPSHSYRKPNRYCYDTFDDCECEHGYKKQGHQCVPDYQCPDNSFPKPSVQYPRSFSDCLCEDGYIKLESQEQCGFIIHPEPPSAPPARAYVAKLEPISGVDRDIYGTVTVVVASYDTTAYAGSATGLDKLLGAEDCTATNGCGVHIHSGFSCENAAVQGGHYFVSPVLNDPWADDRYTTDYNGVGTFAGVATIGTDDIEGRAFIVHGQGGERLACGLLQEIIPSYEE